MRLDVVNPRRTLRRRRGRQVVIVRGLTSASCAYPAVPAEDRATLGARLAASRIPRLDGVFLLSTCLRVEVVVEGDRGRLDDVVRELFGTLPDGTRIHEGAGAVEHLFRVAAGLESPIIGETEILTQFRQAVTDSQDTLSGAMTKVLQSAVSTGRAARERLPESPHGSLAVVAAQMVGPASAVAVLGSGRMATAAAHALRLLPAPPAVTMVARSPEKVTVPGVSVWPFERAAEALRRFPAVISATSAKGVLIDETSLGEVLASRAEPLTLVDLAMPPDFPAADPTLVHYLPIDQVAARAARDRRLDDVDEFVGQAAAAAWARYHTADHVGPVIARLYRSVDGVVAETVERFASKLADPADVEVLRRAVRTAARTLVARPVGRIHESERPGEVATVVAEVFGVDD